MNLIDISNEIQNKIKEIDDIRHSIKERGEKKAQTIAEYEKSIAITLIRLKNSDKFELEGQEIYNPPASIMDKLARGICWQNKLEMEKAEALYKSAITNLDATMAQMNALQSLNRYLDKI